MMNLYHTSLKMIVSRTNSQQVIQKITRLLMLKVDHQLFMPHLLTASVFPPSCSWTRIHKNMLCSSVSEAYINDMKMADDKSQRATSRDIRRNNFFQNLLSDSILKSECRYLSVKEWDELFARHVAKKRNEEVPLRLYEIMVFDESTDDRFDIAKSLKDYITKKGFQYSDLKMRTSYMILLLRHKGENAVDEVLSIYDEIRRDYDVLDAKSINELILALIHTPKWMDCFDLLEMMKISASPTAMTYSNVARGAVIHGDLNTAYKILDSMHMSGLQPLDPVYKAFLTYADECSIKYFLNYLKSKGWIPSSEAAEMIKDWFQREYRNEYQVKCNKFLSKTSDVCPHCTVPLEAIEPLKEEEFEAMRKAFFDKVLYRKGDLYLNTTPKELDQFTNFVQQSGPFDVVIDCLNVSYNTKKKEPVNVRSEVVKSVLKYFVDNGKHVCLMGKKHILREWPASVIDYMNNKGSCFYTSNSSQDDIFMLYAVLQSGLDTYFVTRDELRDHCFLLGPEQGAIFKQWQLQHQIVFRGLTRNKHIFRWPPKHKTIIQQTVSGWHIPYENKELREDFKPPHSWLCLQRLAI